MFLVPVVVLGCRAVVVKEEGSSRRSRIAIAEADAVGSCVGHCGTKADNCWCDDLCEQVGDCCPDRDPMCGTNMTCENAAPAPAAEPDRDALVDEHRVRVERAARRAAFHPSRGGPLPRRARVEL
jgi:hypothetical protein